VIDRKIDGLACRQVYGFGQRLECERLTCCIWIPGFQILEIAVQQHLYAVPAEIEIGDWWIRAVARIGQLYLECRCIRARRQGREAKVGKRLINGALVRPRIGASAAWVHKVRTYPGTDIIDPWRLENGAIDGALGKGSPGAI